MDMLQAFAATKLHTCTKHAGKNSLRYLAVAGGEMHITQLLSHKTPPNT